MQRQAWALASLAVAALLLGACSDRAGQNPNAPGSPGTGNSAELVRPAAPDGPPGGPSGIAGSAPHTGASGGDMLPGTTGRGTTDADGRSQTAQPGQGLTGGLGTGTGLTGTVPPNPAAAGNAGTVPPGSPNRTSGDAVGRR